MSVLIDSSTIRDDYLNRTRYSSSALEVRFENVVSIAPVNMHELWKKGTRFNSSIERVFNDEFDTRMSKSIKRADRIYELSGEEKIKENKYVSRRAPEVCSFTTWTRNCVEIRQGFVRKFSWDESLLAWQYLQSINHSSEKISTTVSMREENGERESFQSENRVSWFNPLMASSYKNIKLNKWCI